MDSVIWWKEVCGNTTLRDAFWDSSISDSETLPDLTDCFQQTVLTWLPAAVLWLVSPCYISYLLSKPLLYTCKDKGWQNITKLVLGVVMLLMYAVQCILPFIKTFPPTPVTYVTPIIQLITMLLVIYIIHGEHQRGEHSSGVPFLYWLSRVILDIVPFRSYILQIQQGADIDMITVGFFYTNYIIIILQFILSWKPDQSALPTAYPGYPYKLHKLSKVKMNEKTPLVSVQFDHKSIKPVDKPCPLDFASFPTRLLLWWTGSLLFTGYKRTLKFEDLHGLMTEDKTESLVPKFEAAWKEQLKKHKHPSFFWAIVKVCKWQFLVGVLYRTEAIIAQFLNPQLLRLLIDFVGDKEQPAWKGYGLALVLFVNLVITTICVVQFLFYHSVCGMRIRSLMTSAIYRKVLKAVRNEKFSTGRIMTMLTADAERLQMSVQMMEPLMSVPIVIVAVFGFMWVEVGYSCLFGLLFLIILLGVNGFLVGIKQKSLQVKQMEQKDSRLKLVNEILNGIKVLKLYAWEKAFEKAIDSIRRVELKFLKWAEYLNCFSSIGWILTPYLVSLIVFTAYTLASSSNILTPDKAFVTLSLINLFNYSLIILPFSVLFLAQANIAIKRVTTFLNADELDSNQVEKSTIPGVTIKIADGDFNWYEGGRTILQNINVEVATGRLVAVVGQVGAGKSSLISAMLGEMYKENGTVHLKGSISYVPQQAWIQNLTVRDNILFSKDFNRAKYEKILEACALKPDLKILAAGDMTEIGEKGINLSGGQKQRVSLARAVYNDADVYLLDDPLSAVDSYVGKHIFEKVLSAKGILKAKTRVLVTHNVTFLPQVDQIFVMKNGEITESGTFPHLIQKNGEFADFLRTYLAEKNFSDGSDDAEDIRELEKQISAFSGTDSDPATPFKHIDNKSRKRAVRQRHLSSRRSVDDRSVSLSESITEASKQKDSTDLGKQIEEETSAVGSVKLSVIKYYIKSGGPWFCFIVLLFHLLYVVAQVVTNIWLSKWTDDSNVNQTQVVSVWVRLGVYGGLGAIQTLFLGIQGIALTYGAVVASRVIHSRVVQRVLKAPMAFFDTTPLGRVVNRFARDMDLVDMNMPRFTRLWLLDIAPLISTLVIISYSTPLFLSIVIPLGILYWMAQRLFVRTAIQLKRLDAVRRSPIFSFFSETISGSSSIRAYKQQERFLSRADELLDNSQAAWFPLVAIQRWLGVNIELIGDSVVLFAAIFAIQAKDTISGSTVGLSITYALQVQTYMNMVIRMATELETNVVSVERIKEYSELDQEAAWYNENVTVPSTWPDRGQVKFHEYSTQYRPGLEMVLKRVSCNIQPGQKLGIVGRTGAGKSSLTLALFRIIEAVSGHISIDGIKTSNIGLHQLRSRLTIIPQDPVLFSGSLRLNLDPLEEHSDAEIWTSLRHAHLQSFVSSLNEGLNYQVGDEGTALSVGQRQLVCLARALLRKKKILVLDEATAAVDMETDELIQQTIRTEFQDCTVITIAHRINTIMDYDQVLVLDQGEIKEYGPPSQLLSIKSSLFYSMAQDAGLI